MTGALAQDTAAAHAAAALSAPSTALGALSAPLVALDSAPLCAPVVALSAPVVALGALSAHVVALDSAATTALAQAIADERAAYRHRPGLYGPHHAMTAELTAPALDPVPLVLFLLAVELLAREPDPAQPETLARNLTAAPAAPPACRPVVGRA